MNSLVISLIGVGKMGSALLKGWIRAGTKREEIIIYDKMESALETFSQQAEIAPNCRTAVEKGDVIVIAVKPKDIAPLLDEIGELLNDKISISLAAGIGLEELRKKAQSKWVRAMPNIACEIGEGFIAICGDEKGLDVAEKIFGLTGKVLRVDESMMDAITALGGSGPGFVSLLIDALADGGVKIGLPKELAIQITAQIFKGTAGLIMHTQRHPMALKDSVCSPAGTTIAGISRMEKAGVRGILIEAVEEAFRRAKELQKGG